MTELHTFILAAVALPFVGGFMAFATRMGYHYMPAKEAAQSGARVAALLAFTSLILIAGKIIWS